MTTTPNPFGDPRRGRSEELAFEAERAWSLGDEDRGRDLFARAAELEGEVALAVPDSMPRVRSVLAVSAVSLWYKSGKRAEAKLLAYSFLAGRLGLTDAGRGELEELVERCSRETEIATVAHATRMVPIDIKLDGGRVGTGIAPAASARRRRRATESVLTRCAEYEAGVAYRKQGESDLKGEHIQLFEARGIAASYGLRFYIATGDQLRTATEALVAPDRVAQRFLDVAASAAEGAEALRAQIGDAQYSAAFIKGFAEIAPDGEDVHTVVCSAPSWTMRHARPQQFTVAHRRALRVAVDAQSIAPHPKPDEKTVRGSFSGAWFGTDECWMKIQEPAKSDVTVVLVTTRKLRRLVADIARPREVEVIAYAAWSDTRERLILRHVETVGASADG